MACFYVVMLAALARATMLRDFAVEPEQVHIALTERQGEMRAIWITLIEKDDVGDCKWAQQSTDPKSVAATTHTYPDGGFNGTIHQCIMTGLVEGGAYR